MTPAEAADLSQKYLEPEAQARMEIDRPHPRERRSRKLQRLDCLFYKQIPRQVLAETQLPTVVHDSKGPIHKPEGW